MQFALEFEKRINEIYLFLKKASSEQVVVRPSPEKWSVKEIIGHLIDSANNNHRRFTEAQLKDDLIFSGYAQADWVEVQKYQEASWILLLDLWKVYNLHIAHIMKVTPEHKLYQPLAKHNLHEIAMYRVSADQETSLAYFMKDYIRHIEHHYQQIVKLLE